MFDPKSFLIKYAADAPSTVILGDEQRERMQQELQEWKKNNPNEPSKPKKTYNMFSATDRAQAITAERAKAEAEEKARREQFTAQQKADAELQKAHEAARVARIQAEFDNAAAKPGVKAYMNAVRSGSIPANVKSDIGAIVTKLEQLRNAPDFFNNEEAQQAAIKYLNALDTYGNTLSDPIKLKGVHDDIGKRGMSAMAAIAALNPDTDDSDAFQVNLNPESSDDPDLNIPEVPVTPVEPVTLMPEIKIDAPELPVVKMAPKVNKTQSMLEKGWNKFKNFAKTDAGKYTLAGAGALGLGGLGYYLWNKHKQNQEEEERQQQLAADQYPMVRSANYSALRTLTSRYGK